MVVAWLMVFLLRLDKGHGGPVWDQASRFGNDHGSVALHIPAKSATRSNPNLPPVLMQSRPPVS